MFYNSFLVDVRRTVLEAAIIHFVNLAWNDLLPQRSDVSIQFSSGAK